MEPTVETVNTVQEIAKNAGLAPNVQMLITLLALVVLMAWPVMMLVRQWQKNRNEARKESAVTDGDEATYQRMKEQIESHEKIITGLVDEKNKWFTEATQLRSEVSQMRGYKKMVEQLQVLLDSKEVQLAKKDQQLEDSMKRVLDMNERVHALELRIARDEARFKNCPKCGAELL